jgi:hypothetical protein
MNTFEMEYLRRSDCKMYFLKEDKEVRRLFSPKSLHVADYALNVGRTSL